MAGSSLARLASSGLCASLTSQKEFVHARGSFALLVFEICAVKTYCRFSMTYNDFVSLLRCVAGPILLADQDDSVDEDFGANLSWRHIFIDSK